MEDGRPKAAKLACMTVARRYLGGNSVAAISVPHLHSGRMLNEADVDGGSREPAARAHGHEFSNLAHGSPTQAI